MSYQHPAFTFAAATQHRDHLMAAAAFDRLCRDGSPTPGPIARLARHAARVRTLVAPATIRPAAIAGG